MSNVLRRAMVISIAERLDVEVSSSVVIALSYVEKAEDIEMALHEIQARKDRDAWPVADHNSGDPSSSQ